MLLEKLKNFNIYLASQSPRRIMLLQEMGIDFNIATSIEINEDFNSELKAEEIALFLAEKKSNAYSFILKENRLLITADTIVWINDKVLGKPKNAKQAKEMLLLLSGKKHSVITGITIRTSNKIHSFYCKTNVWFKNLKNSEIDYYIKNYKPFDKAGAYGIQEWIGSIGIKKIEGSYYNVVGLPTEQLFSELEHFLS